MAEAGRQQSLREALVNARQRLEAGGIEDAALEAEVLLRHALDEGGGVVRARLYQRLAQSLEDAVSARLEALLLRRLAREPSAYITGRREFYGIELAVTPAVLIPRPETEHVVEAVLEEARRLGRRGRLSVADAGTGSGAIAVAVAASLPAAEVYATELSCAALAVAGANARRHGVERRIVLRHGDLLTPLDGYVDVIAANLPYVPTDQWRRLAPEVRDHEPSLALDGGRDGLDAIRALLRQAPRYLRAGGAVCLEFGDGQEEGVRASVRDLMPGAETRVVRDLAGKARVMVARLA